MCNPRMICEVAAGVTRNKVYETSDGHYTVFTYRGRDLIGEEINISAGAVMTNYGINVEVFA